MAMFIRVKRQKTTYFIQCDPTEKVMDIKQKLCGITEHLPDDLRLILPDTNEVLEDSKTLADLKVENDAVVALTLRTENGDFEEVDIVKPDDFYQSRDGESF